MIEITMLPDPYSSVPLSALQTCKLGRGQVLFRQNQPAAGPYFVVQGEVELVRHTKAGRQVTLFRATSGETVAEASLFSKHYHCDCVAKTDSSVIRLKKSAILDAIERRPEFALALLKRLAGDVQDYRRRLEIMAITSAEDRVLAALEEFGQPKTVMQFAQSVSLSHEATYRALSSLVTSGKAERIGRGKYRVR